MGTNVPSLIFTNAGFVAPTSEAIEVGVQADMQAAFSGNLNFTTSGGGNTNPTPQAQLADSFTAVIDDTYSQLAALFNSVDPAVASGRMQDAIARIYNVVRNPALPTTVECTCAGSAATIPNGVLAQDIAGNTYQCVVGGVLPPGGGTVTLEFQNVIPGPTPCPAGTLTVIYQAIPGWDSITNPADGVIGQNTETRAALELRREQSVEGNSLGQIGSIIGAIAKLAGVLDFYGQDNPTAAPVTVNGFTIPAFSIYIAVSGGDQNAIASAILSKKSPGAPMAGNTTVTAFDTNPLYASPVPYSITFERPSPLAIVFSVTLKNSTGVPAGALALVQNAVISMFAGDDAGPRARINSLLFASRFYSGVAALGSWAQIVSILIGSANARGAAFTGSIAANTLTVSAISSGALAAGQVVIGANVADGTLILSQASGSPGGIGTYTIGGAPQTVGSEAMSGVVATLNDLQVNANQEPTIAAANISLVLV